VRAHSAGFQPHLDIGFPHGADQRISAAGTSPMTIALTDAMPSAATHSVASAAAAAAISRAGSATGSRTRNMGYPASSAARK